MHTLPVNYAGLALIIFAIILFLLEIKVVSYGILAIGGTISLLLGSFMLLRNESPLEFARISKAVIIPAVAVTAGFFFFLITMGVRAQRNVPVTGFATLVGSMGTAEESFEESGMVKVRGEIWQAESTVGSIVKGQTIRVTGRRKFTLFIEPV
jgi:membrane-bound serine protease (ClpP class)